MTIESITNNGITEQYTSIPFQEILDKVRRFNGVKICNYKLYSLSGFSGKYSQFVSKNECISSTGNIFEYPVWYNDEFGEGSENAENVEENIIRVAPKFSSKLFGRLCWKNINNIVIDIKLELRKFINATPIKENDTRMIYLEKIKDIENGRILVKATIVKCMNDFLLANEYIPAGPF